MTIMITRLCLFHWLSSTSPFLLCSANLALLSSRPNALAVTTEMSRNPTHFILIFNSIRISEPRLSLVTLLSSPAPQDLVSPLPPSQIQHFLPAPAWPRVSHLQTGWVTGLHDTRMFAVMYCNDAFLDKTVVVSDSNTLSRILQIRHFKSRRH